MPMLKLIPCATGHISCTSTGSIHTGDQLVWLQHHYHYHYSSHLRGHLLRLRALEQWEILDQRPISANDARAG
jgi:hypothetical protein